MSDQYYLVVDEGVQKELLDFQPKQYKQVVSKILSLASNPRQQDCKMLKGHPGNYRADQGEFRILYRIQDPTKDKPGEVQVFRVGKRNDGEVYKNL